MRSIAHRVGPFCWGIALVLYGCADPRSTQRPKMRPSAHADAARASFVAGEEDGGTVEDSGAVVQAPQRGYWSGTKRRFAMSPAGNVVGISCHNCYRKDLATSPENLDATLSKLHQAQQDGADLLELDVEEQAGTWYVGHDDDGSINGAALDDVLADDGLLQGDQVLYIELKEQDPNENRILELLTSIATAGYAVQGRIVVLRAFNSIIEDMHVVRRLLDAGEVPDGAAFFRTQVLYTMAEAADAASIHALIDSAVKDRFDGVEFNYTSKNVLELLDYARSSGLATNVWTFGVNDGTANCRKFRDVTDAITTDSALTECRAAVETP